MLTTLAALEDLMTRSSADSKYMEMVKSGARFDHAYYANKHMPMVKSKLGDACESYTVDKGLAGGAPGAPPLYVGMCHIFCDSVEVFQGAFGPHAQEIMADIPSYTDLAPVIQISEVVVG